MTKSDKVCPLVVWANNMKPENNWMKEEKFIVESASKHMKAGRHGTYLQKNVNVFCIAEWTPNKDNSLIKLFWK